MSCHHAGNRAGRVETVKAVHAALVAANDAFSVWAGNPLRRTDCLTDARGLIGHAGRLVDQLARRHSTRMEA